MRRQNGKTGAALDPKFYLSGHVAVHHRLHRAGSAEASVSAPVKVFRCRPSQTSHTASGRRLKTSKERNRGKGHVLGGARALTMGII